VRNGRAEEQDHAGGPVETKGRLGSAGAEMQQGGGADQRGEEHVPNTQPVRSEVRRTFVADVSHVPR
jgi:hypothetical protein